MSDTGLVAVTEDAVDLRRAYASFPSGVAAVCTLQGERPIGIAASSFVAVSLDPPLVSVCVQHTSTTWPRLRGAARLGVSVLAADQHEICRDLAAKDGDRFARVR
jgi:flavin reductase (DIM6/NTAB) family NADH-FMN oxidoreductase RutF